MTQRDLGERMSISPQAVAQLEAREPDGAVTLGALREAARAMGGELFYVAVPEQSVSAMLEARAEVIARGLAGQVRHSMRMEDQETDQAEWHARFSEFREALLRNPSALWTIPEGDGRGAGGRGDAARPG